jgi:hypothetical protein
MHDAQAELVTAPFVSVAPLPPNERVVARAVAVPSNVVDADDLDLDLDRDHARVGGGESAFATSSASAFVEPDAARQLVADFGGLCNLFSCWLVDRQLAKQRTRNRCANVQRWRSCARISAASHCASSCRCTTACRRTAT